MRKPQDVAGRCIEWKKLSDLWSEARAGEARLVVLSGSRQVGKTWLTSRFAEAAGGFRYQFRGLAETEEMRALTGALGRRSGPLAVVAAAAPTSWSAFLEAVAETSAERPVLVVLDEVPYLADTRRSWARELQAVWDSSVAGRRRRLMVVLIGSALRVMEQLIASRGALYGRAESLRLAPFGLGEIAAARKLTPAAVIECYACTGGLPRLALGWRRGSMRSNLMRLALAPDASMLGLADEMLHHDSLEGPSYRRILQAIAAGHHRYSRIVRVVDLRVEESLDVLESAGYVRRRLPLGASPRSTKEAEYRVTSPFLALAWGPLARARLDVESGDADLAYAAVAGQLRQHVAAVFEEAAREHARHLVATGELPRCVSGDWWTHRGRGAQLDVLGLGGRRALFAGEAKWGARASAALRQLDASLERTPFAADRPVRVIWTRTRDPKVRARSYGVAALVDDLRRSRT